MRIAVFSRRLLCCLLVCLLLVHVALAEVNLSSMTDDEVVDLLAQVNQEIVNRGINKTAKLPKGRYIAGKEIPAGRYIYTVLATGSEWGNVTVYADEGEGTRSLWEVVTAPDPGEEPETIFMTLNEGDELKSGVPFSLTIMTGVLFE